MTTTTRNAEWHDLLAIFTAESLEQMDTAETALLKLEGSESGEPSVRREISGLFRLFHSLKGGAASLELNVLRDATHQAENLLQLFQASSLNVSGDHVDLMCRTCDLARKALNLAITTGQDDNLAEDAGILIVALNCEFSKLRVGTTSETVNQPQKRPSETPGAEPAGATGHQAIVKTLLFDTLSPPADLLSNYGTDQFPSRITELDIPVTAGMRAGVAREGAILIDRALTSLQEDRDTPRIGSVVAGSLRHLAALARFFGYAGLQESLESTMLPLLLTASKRHRIWPGMYCEAVEKILLQVTDYLTSLGASDGDTLPDVSALDTAFNEFSDLLSPQETAGLLFTDGFPGELLDDCREETTLLLAEIQTGIEELGAGEKDLKVLSGLSRAFHSIKGAGGLLVCAASRDVNDDHPLRLLVRVVHEVESILGPLQGSHGEDEKAVSPADFDFIRDVHGAVRNLLDIFFAGEPVEITLPVKVAIAIGMDVDLPIELAEPIPTGEFFAASLEELKLPLSSEIRQSFETEGIRLCDMAELSLKEAREHEDDAGALLQMFKTFHALAGLAQFYGFPEVQSLCKIAEALVHCLLSGIAFSHKDNLYDSIASSLTTLRKDFTTQDVSSDGASQSPSRDVKAPSVASPDRASSVVGRMREILAEVNARQAQAELFAPGTKPEDLFEKQMLRDFREEGEQVLQHVEEILAGIAPDCEARKSLDAAMRVFHSIKSNAALMISGAQSPLPPRHPLQFIRAIAHGAEALLAASRDNPLAILDAQNLQVLTRSLEIFRALRQDFFKGEAFVDVPLDLLQSLGLSIGQFRQTDLTLLNQCMSSFTSHPVSVDRAQVLAFLEALKNLTEVCTRLGRSDLFTSIRAQQQLLDVWLAESPQPSFETTLTKLGEHYQTLIQLIQKPATAHAKQVAAAEKVRTTRDEPADAGNRVTLRVDEEKVDRLLRLVGELVMARNPFSDAANTLAGQGLPQIAHDIRRADMEVARLANELQRTVNSIRMLPVRSVFQRFPRLVRVLAKDLGKELRLDMHGENTEVDKTVVELLADPLVHLVRNAVDHGVELPEERKKRGKKPEGTVQLSAVTEGNLVTISVSDDGKGLDPVILKNKAVEKGLIDQETAARMSEQEAFQLVFLAGFSTAEKLTDVSGRGVGMDVVATNIRRLHGTVHISSKIGQGSVFSLRIPANYIQAILVQSQHAEFLIPVDAVSCLVKVDEADIHEYRKNQLLTVRGRVYPFMALAEILGQSGDRSISSSPSDNRVLPVAVLESSAGTLAVGVDRFLGEMQVMIKPLASEMGENPLFAGASIMGDGRIVLVLNPQELSRQVAVRVDQSTKIQ
jgi:two-component system chemotaxis sensor kinase CheA